MRGTNGVTADLVTPSRRRRPRRSPAGQTWRVPDDYDYRAFWGLLLRPKTWTASERSAVEFSLAQQRNMLASVHPKDERGRKRIAEVVDQIETAIANADDA